MAQILLLRRFKLVHSHKVGPAGANLQIRPFVLSASVIILQDNDRSSNFFAHESANNPHND